MVLCAVSKDHSQVCLLDVPANTIVGERVLFPGFPKDSIPATPSQMVKKKILEGLAPKVYLILVTYRILFNRNIVLFF